MMLRRVLAVAFCAALSFAPFEAFAGLTTWPQQTNLVLSGSGITLLIDAGSEADSLTVNPSDFTVTVAGGDTFTVRYPGPSYGTMNNDGGISSCNPVGGDNVSVVTGPKTVTFTPVTTPCTPPPAGGGGGGGAAPNSIHLSIPNGGEVLPVGSTYRIYWSYTGSQLQGVRLLLSTDGSSFTAIGPDVSHLPGYYDWTVPSFASDQNARLRVQLLGGGGTVLATDDSDGTFLIDAPSTTPVPPTPEPTPVPEPVPAPGPIDPTATIAQDMGLTDTGTPLSTFCKAHELIKLADDGNAATQADSAVYYCGIDGKRYAFPNAKAYATWYIDFSKVIVVSPEAMAALPLGGLVTYRPGARLVKIQTDPKTYVVERGGLLRHIPDEATAVALFGPRWNTFIDDIDVAFFVNYRIGPPLPSVQL